MKTASQAAIEAARVILSRTIREPLVADVCNALGVTRSTYHAYASGISCAGRPRMEEWAASLSIGWTYTAGEGWSTVEVCAPGVTGNEPQITGETAWETWAEALAPGDRCRVEWHGVVYDARFVACTSGGDAEVLLVGGAGTLVPMVVDLENVERRD